MQEVLDDFGSSQSSTQASSAGPSQAESESLSDMEQEICEDERQLIEEVEINGKAFVLVPKHLSKYVPASSPEIQFLEGFGIVEVSDEFIYLPKSLLPKIQESILNDVDLQKEVALCREKLWTLYGRNDAVPPFDPDTVKDLCISAGASKLFDTIMTAMSSEEKSSLRQHQNEKKAVSVIYMLVFGQSQKANWFQKIVAQNTVGKGLSESGLSVLNSTGIAVSKSTQRRHLRKTADRYVARVQSFIDDAIDRKCLLVLMVDDYTNIHTKQRPKDQETSSAKKMATILLKKFPTIPAIALNEESHIYKDGISISILNNFIEDKMPQLFSSFATAMPHWVRSSFFNPEIERHRLETHDYQEDQVNPNSLRRMEHCCLVDEIEQPLRSFNDFLKASSHAVNLGLDKYLHSFLCPQPGDWPAQFYMRQIQYNLPADVPLFQKNIIPMIGPLHIQLNARECLCCLNIAFFQKAYSFIFGKRKVLATKPKPCRISMIEELLYGGWTKIRDHVIIAFSNSKDIQYLTLLNILDNYLPLVLSIYSVIFKTGHTEEDIDAMLRCWLMFFCFKRHHYDKAPLVWLSNVLFWKSNNHPLFHAITTFELLQ